MTELTYAQAINAGIREEMRARLLRWSILTEDANSVPLFYDPNTFSDTPIGSSDFYYADLDDQ